MRAGDTLETAKGGGRAVGELLLPAIALGTMLAPFNATMVAVALPAISDDLDVGLRDLSWIVVGYLITMAVTQPIAGKLGDLFGRRKLFLGALVGFALASIGAALAPNLPTLLAMRVGQALSSAMATPNGAALIREWVPQHRRAAAFGIVGASAGLAAGIGPPIGGAMIALGGWRAMFWFNIPVVLLAFVFAWRSLPRDRGAKDAGGFDFRGAALLAGTLTALALVASAIKGGDAWAIFGLTAAALVMGSLFVNHERLIKEPIIRLSLFRIQTFRSATLTILFSNMAMYTTLLVIPLFLVDLQGRSTLQVGFVLGAMSLPLVFLSPLGGRLADRWGRRTPAIVGGVLVLSGLLPFLAVDESWGLGLIAMLLALIGSGMALQLPAIQTAALESVPERDAGMAAGVYSLGRYVGSIVGAAVLVALLGTGADAGDAISIAAVSTVFVMAVVASAGALISPMWIRNR